MTPSKTLTWSLDDSWVTSKDSNTVSHSESDLGEGSGMINSKVLSTVSCLNERGGRHAPLKPGH